VIEADLSDWSHIAKVMSDGKYNAVIHFAANIVVPESVSDPLKYYMNNTVNTTHLIQQCVQNGVNRFIFSSTAAVYGEPAPEMIPIKETTPLAPINPYGSSKLMSETVLRDASAAHPDFKHVILRYFNVAGADLKNRIGECHKPETHLVPLITHTALGKRDSIYIYGDDYDTPDGTCIRDYIHVEDLASAHLCALDYLEDNPSDVFNCGYGHGYSVRQVVETMQEVSKNDFKVEIKERRSGDPATLVADNAKILNKLGWQPKYDDLEFICKTALEWENKR
jgi:UDP-glucose 4-epimerase